MGLHDRQYLARGEKTVIPFRDLAQAEMGALFNNAIVDERIGFYRRLVARRPASERFLRGWLARAERFRVEVANV